MFLMNSFPSRNKEGWHLNIARYITQPRMWHCSLFSSIFTHRDTAISHPTSYLNYFLLFVVATNYQAWEKRLSKIYFQIQCDSADWRWDQYSLTSCPNSDPSLFINFIGSSYSTSFPEIERKDFLKRFLFIFWTKQNQLHYDPVMIFGDVNLD